MTEESFSAEEREALGGREFAICVGKFYEEHRKDEEARREGGGGRGELDKGYPPGD